MEVQLLTCAEVAREVGRSASLVRQLANLGKLPVFARTQYGTRLFAKSDVDRLLAERRENGIGAA